MNKLSKRDCLLLAIMIGILTSSIYIYAAKLGGMNSSDFRYSINIASDWLAGKDPYIPYHTVQYPPIVAYPFTAAVLSIPFIKLPFPIAEWIFAGLGSALLAWLILSRSKPWLLLILLSWPFINSLIFGQWVTYAISLFFTSSMLPVLLVKPQIALPFVLTKKPNLTGLLLASFLLILSIVLYPKWPLDWIKLIQSYGGYPLLFVIPLGPIILLSLIRYKDKRSWLLVLLSAMPQRMVYDQLGVLLIAEDKKQLIFLILCSWISFPALLYFHGWDNMPWGWKTWVFLESYLPALIVVLLPTIVGLKNKVWKPGVAT